MTANIQSNNIFLYVGVIKIFGRGDGQIPVFQMLSERHSARAIAFWMMAWISRGASVPSEIVIDDSAALISAICTSFAAESSAAAYIRNALLFLQGEQLKKPRCLIRIDVAHLTNLVRKWPEISKMKRRPKEFYIRVIMLVAQAETLEEAEEILECIFVVCKSETEGNSTTTGKATPCETRKKNLLCLISGIPYDEPESSEMNDQDSTYSSKGDDEEEGRDCDGLEEPGMKTWIERIISKAEGIISDDDDRDNIMHCPEIQKKIKRLCYTLPL